jgi:hypothetical protein
LLFGTVVVGEGVSPFPALMVPLAGGGVMPPTWLFDGCYYFDGCCYFDAQPSWLMLLVQNSISRFQRYHLSMVLLLAVLFNEACLYGSGDTCGTSR